MGATTTGGSRQAPARRVQKRRHGWGRRLFLLLLLVLLLAGGTAATLYFTRPVTFFYRGMELEALRGVPVNTLDPACFSTDDRGRVTYAQGGVTARTGIDVSFYQGDIDWTAVAADGIDFAFLRLGYRGYQAGGLQMDTAYAQNLAGAKAAGLDVGVYFFSQAISVQEAEEEADYVLAALDGAELELPVVFDWEFITPGKSARTDSMEGALLTQCAKAFCEKLQAAGYTPMVYFNQELGYLTYDLKELTRFPFWLAEYDSRPDFYYGFSFWQYTHTGTVAGIQGSVDLDLELRKR